MMGTIQKITVRGYKSICELNGFEALSLNNSGILSNEIGIMRKNCLPFNAWIDKLEQMGGQ